jgi:ATP-dependent RNA helicase SUPV3L1/SUV3
VARLVAGDGLLTPRVDVFGTELLDPMGRERVRRRLAGFVERLLRQRLAPLFALRDAPLTGTARGMAFALVEGGGALARRAIAGQVRSLTGEDRRALARAGVTVGRLALFLPALFRSASERLRLRLWGLRRGEPPELRLGPPSLPRRTEVSADAYLAAGYQGMGPLAVRVDRLDRLTAMLDQASRNGPFPAPEESEGLLGARPADVRRVILALGYTADGPELYKRRAPRPERQRAAR